MNAMMHKEARNPGCYQNYVKGPPLTTCAAVLRELGPQLIVLTLIVLREFYGWDSIEGNFTIY